MQTPDQELEYDMRCEALQLACGSTVDVGPEQVVQRAETYFAFLSKAASKATNPTN